MNDGLVPCRGIDHGVINRAVRPLDFEILFDEISPFEIDGVHQLMGLLLGLRVHIERAIPIVLILMMLLLALTIFNRARRALQELSADAAKK